MRAGQAGLIVLVVEDDALIRCDVVSELSAQGWDVLDAPSGDAALALAKDNRVDVLVTDIQLGDSANGWVVAEGVRDLWPDAAVIYTSGNTSDRSRLVRGGVFFNKPCDLGQLADTCHRLCAPHA